MQKQKSRIITFLFGLMIGHSSTFLFQHTIQQNKKYLKSIDSKIEPLFTPGDACTERIVRHINKAKKEILVQAYSFTSKPIIDALIKKHKEGIKVIVVLDKSQENTIYTMKILSEKLDVFIDKLPGIAHNKVIIIDRNEVFTGSFNFSQAAETKNAENSILIAYPEAVSKYVENFLKRVAVSYKISQKLISKL